MLDADCRYTIKQNTSVFVSQSQELQTKFHEFTMKLLYYEFQIHENLLVRKYACSDKIWKIDGEYVEMHHYVLCTLCTFSWQSW